MPAEPQPAVRAAVPADAERVAAIFAHYVTTSVATFEEVALHRRFGFTQAGLLSGVGRKHGRWIDTLLMQKELESSGPAR